MAQAGLIHTQNFRTRKLGTSFLPSTPGQHPLAGEILFLPLEAVAKLVVATKEKISRLNHVHDHWAYGQETTGFGSWSIEVPLMCIERDGEGLPRCHSYVHLGPNEYHTVVAPRPHKTYIMMEK
jgi:hypothetical protein